MQTAPAKKDGKVPCMERHSDVFEASSPHTHWHGMQTKYLIKHPMLRLSQMEERPGHVHCTSRTDASQMGHVVPAWSDRSSFFWFPESKKFNFSQEFSAARKPAQYVTSPTRRFADRRILDRLVDVEASLAMTNAKAMLDCDLRRGTREKCAHCEYVSELKKLARQNGQK